MTTPSSRSTERVKRLQAQAARRERNRRLTIAGTAIAVVVLVVAALVIAKLASGGGSNDAIPPPTGGQQVIAKVTAVPVGALDAVGAGTASNPPKKVAGGSTPLTANGKPEFLYIGAEFCPYCAATRWGVVVALSRFGTFVGLGQTSSAGSDVFPNTPTLTFHGASFSSKYLTLHADELTDRNHNSLDTPTAADNAIFHKYDSPPYVDSSTAGAIPFIDIGGTYFLFGSAYDPQTLHGLTHAQVADALSDPTSSVAKAIDGEANMITAAICATTNQQPSTVCSSTGVTTAAAKLGSGG